MRTAEVPEGLAAMPPVPGMAAALGAVEPARVPDDRILVLRAQYRQLSHEQARMAAVIAEVGRCEGHPEPCRVQRLDAPGVPHLGGDPLRHRSSPPAGSRCCCAGW